MKKKVRANFIVISLKNNLLTIMFALFMVCLLVFSKQNMLAAKNALYLWVNSVVPSLLPFFIATELLSYTNLPSIVGNLLNPIMEPIFNVPGIGAYAFIMGIISGYPIGAKIVTELRQKGLCTKQEGERLLAFTNNSGPLFIIGTVGISLFGNTSIGVLLFLTHISACITVGIIFRFWKKNSMPNNFPSNFVRENFKENISPRFNNLGEILTKSILSAIHNIVLIGGFILVFGLIISILNSSGIMKMLSNFISPLLYILRIPSSFSEGIISGILELTNGLKIISNIPNKAISINIIVCAFLLGFSGISIALQIFSITTKSDLSIKAYLIGKLLQGIFAAIYTYILVHLFPVFNLDLVSIFSDRSSTKLIKSYYMRISNTYFNFYMYYYFIFSIFI